MTFKEQTRPLCSHPLDPILLKLKLAFFYGLCGANCNRYLSIKGLLIRAVAWLGLYERENIRALSRFVSAGDTVLDIGANVGVYSIALARAVGPSGVVFAFEPLPFLIPQLINCTKKYPVVCVKNIALGRSPQPLVRMCVPLLFGKIPEPALATLQRCDHKSEDVEVSVSTIDASCGGGSRVSFIKMDVEGHELEVLEGGRATLLRDRPVVQLESNPDAAASSAIDTFAAELGYVRAVLRSGVLILQDCAGDLTRGNHYLIPRESISPNSASPVRGSFNWLFVESSGRNWRFRT